MIAGVENSNQIFNIVFFITILSLVVQGTTVSYSAQLLGLAAPEEKKDTEFGVELPEGIKAIISEIKVTDKLLSMGVCLMEIPLPDNTLVVMIKRDNNFLIPKGKTRLYEHDKLLVISENEEELKLVYDRLGIDDYSIYKNKL